MKSKLVLLGIMAITSVFLFACSPVANQASVELSCDDFSQQQHLTKEVAVAVGDSLTVTLCSNPTTGFSWSEQAQIDAQDVLKQTGHKIVPAEAKGGGGVALGAPGKEVWTFDALGKGTGTISMEYSRPWEGGEKAEWTFDLTVMVK